MLIEVRIPEAISLQLYCAIHTVIFMVRNSLSQLFQIRHANCFKPYYCTTIVIHPFADPVGSIVDIKGRVLSTGKEQIGSSSKQILFKYNFVAY